MVPSPESSFDEALKRASAFFSPTKSQHPSHTESPDLPGKMGQPTNFLNRSRSFGAQQQLSTPEEYKRQLQQQRLSDILLNSPPGQIQWPSRHLSFTEPPGETRTPMPEEDTRAHLESFSEKPGPSETAEDKLRLEAAEMRAMEEREISQLYEDADRQARKEHQKFLKRYTELQEVLESQYRRDEERILSEITERKQVMIRKARRDSELLVELHKTLSEKSAESATAFAAKSKEIVQLAEKAKQEEEKLILERKLQILREENKKKFQDAVCSIEKSISTLQKDLPESQSAKEELIKMKTSLEDPANLEKTSLLDETLREMKKILDGYAAALVAREEKKAQEAKVPPKQKPEGNRYIQAVEKLKRSTESFSKFIENNKTLRGNIMRFVQLTVNKIQKQTNNQEHALAFVKLFSGDTVPVGIGNETVCVPGQGTASTYAMDLTAKKILDNVEKLPSDPVQEWLPYGTVVATLWSMSAKFGEIFFDNLASRCPFVVPLYFSELSADEAMQYVESYVHYKNEAWSNFIRRMGYYSRLLGVICTMRPRWGPPFPPGKMWTLMAATVKCEVKTKELAEVSAIMMKSLLETSGHTMKASYGKQFSKFTHLLCTEYFDTLQSVAKNAPIVVSLEIYMKEIITAGGRFTPIS